MARLGGPFSLVRCRRLASAEFETMASCQSSAASAASGALSRTLRSAFAAPVGQKNNRGQTTVSLNGPLRRAIFLVRCRRPASAYFCDGLGQTVAN